jgi:hypothetical protein
MFKPRGKRERKRERKRNQEREGKKDGERAHHYHRKIHHLNEIISIIVA